MKIKNNISKFVKYNANPFGVKTGDCVIRAISTALNISWARTYKEMLDVTLETGYAISCKDNFTEYLKRKGFKKQKMPKRANGKKYRLSEFIDEIADAKGVYVVSVYNHLTEVDNATVHDLWDCRNRCVLGYWKIK